MSPTSVAANGAEREGGAIRKGGRGGEPGENRRRNSQGNRRRAGGEPEANRGTHEDIDGGEPEEQFAGEDAYWRAAGGDGLEPEGYVFNYRRICNPKPPFSPDNEAADDEAATPGRRARTRKEPRVADEGARTKAAAEELRVQARRYVGEKIARKKQRYDKKWRQARAQVEQGAQTLAAAGQFARRTHGRLE